MEHRNRWTELLLIQCFFRDQKMKLFIARGTLQFAALVLTALVLLGAEDAQAQRGGAGATEQSQVGGAGAQFGAVGPTQGIGQAGQGQGQAGGFGQSNNRNGNNRQTRGGQDGFIGNDAQQARNDRNRRNANQPRRRNANNSIENLNDRRQGNQGQGNRGGNAPKVQVRIRPLFRVQPQTSLMLNAQVGSHMSRAMPTNTATSISINGSTATLVGSVQSDYDKRLAAKMLSMQPGISTVENNLIVVPSLIVR